MSKKKYDIEKDLRTLEIHEPSEGFASKVTMIARQQAETEIHIHLAMKWIPKFCVAGFILLFGLFLFLLLRYANLDELNDNTILVLRGIGFIGISYLSYIVLDRFLKQRIVGMK
ncbi:MAG: hypothetical protein AAF391_10840 [Bacteroidota bacterium]